MQPTTREIGLRVGNILEALFNDPQSAFAKLPPAAVLTTAYSCSKMNEGMCTFALRAVEHGGQFLAPVGLKMADLRTEAGNRVAIGFLTNVKAVVEIGIPSIRCDTVSHYEPTEIQKMAQDIMFHLCS